MAHLKAVPSNPEPVPDGSGQPVAPDSANTSAPASKSRAVRRKANHYLPTDRITFAKQLDTLRGFAIASGANGQPVKNQDVASIVKMSYHTIALANPFFVEAGFLGRSDGGRFTPSGPVVEFARAFQWSPENAPLRLAPVVQATWFAEVILRKANFGAVDEEEVLTDLALAVGAHVSTESRPQLRLLLDYMQAAGLIERDGGRVRATAAAPTPPQPGLTQGDDRPQERESPGPRSPLITTAYSKPTEGGVQFNVNVRVDMAEFATWRADRIAAFFTGIAKVLAAKANIEEDAASDDM